MATKKELINELLGLDENLSEVELNKKTNKQLEKLLAGYDKKEEKVVENHSNDLLKQMQEQMALMMKQMESLKAENESLKEAKKTVSDVEPVVVPKRKADIDRNKIIPVMNVTAGHLVYLSRRSGAEWNWSKYGDIEYMEMQEIVTMRSSQRKFLDEPFILILDDEAVSYLGLERMYEKMIKPNNIDRVFRMSNEEFKDVVEQAPKGIQILIVNRAKQLFDNGELDSVAKINFINEKFNTYIGR